MKRLLVLLLTIFVLNGCEQDTTITDATAEKQLPKVDVCHYNSETDTWETINISENAVKAHLGHGDVEGRCEDRKTYIPDDGFEWYLVYYGYDDVMDDYVLTANIENIESMNWDDWCCTSPWVDWPYGENPWDIINVEDLTGLEDFKSLKNFNIAGDFKFVRYNLDLYKVPHLERLTMNNVLISEIDLSQNVALREIYIEDAGLQFDVLDLSNSLLLETIYIGEVNLLGLNIKNGNNELISSFSAYYVDCIQVDNAEYSTSKWGAFYNFSEDCGY